MAANSRSVGTTWQAVAGEVRPGESTVIEPAELVLDPPTGVVVVDSETGAEHASFNRVTSKVT